MIKGQRGKYSLRRTFVWSGWIDPGEARTLQQRPADRSLPMLLWQHTGVRCSASTLCPTTQPVLLGDPRNCFTLNSSLSCSHRALLSVLLSALKATSAACESGCLALSFLSPSTSLLTKKVGVFVIFYKSPFGWDPDPSCFPQNLHAIAPLVPGIKRAPKSP